ncbi:unknown; predicted coding region [Mycoplasmopsis pulmonis]|uniref:Uncharacterized protein n=1 Tax=Mycoplasmopsis pulmonis (strain UAB CTIP) TaxID=272635 RepID=Q98QL1_MYCPU|nr:unknown; predicted coding region [Mycoplasmopsis pulmonis]
MAYLLNFLNPLSLENLKSSRSPEPTKAPEKPFESGEVIRDKIIINNEQITKKTSTTIAIADIYPLSLKNKTLKNTMIYILTNFRFKNVKI